MKSNRIISILLIVILFVACFSIHIKATPSNDKEFGNDRYTVLVLDTAGKAVFHFYNYGILSRILGPSEYIANDSIDEVKASAGKFIKDVRYSINKNYIAIVTYDEDATLVCDFTDDYDYLEEELSKIKSLKEKDATDGNDNVTAGLDTANELLSTVDNQNAIKNVLLCTTGHVNAGKNSYDGVYNADTIASGWQNEDTHIKLYAYANCAIEAANSIKESNATIYVIGIFQPIESSMPSEGKEVAEFFRITAHDIASSDETFFVVEDPNELDFVFEELQDDVAGTKIIRIYNDSDGYNSNAPIEYPDDDTVEFGGHYEDMSWGPSLFETPSTRIHLQSIVSSDSPNYNLAMVCGNLCITSYNSDYLIQAYKTIGFSEEQNNIYLYSYPSSKLNRSEAKRNGNRFADDKDLAFSIASQEIRVDGEDCDLLVITLRGTQDKWEAVKDGTCKDDKEFYEYIAWDWIYEFEEDVFAGLEDYHTNHPELGERKLKILVTGHSLGGAGANLVAAKLNKEVNSNNWFSKNTSLDDIYTYTFGAIDSISKDATNSDIFKTYVEFPVANGFENILNIYNYLDTFGPSGGGVFGITAAGNSMYGKFGLFYTFTDNMRDVTNPDSMWPTHEIVGYIHAVKSGWLSSDKETDKLKVWIRCPVDVELYEGDTLVCSIVDDAIKKESAQVPVSVEDGAKLLILSNKADYKIIISATDKGTMEYSIQNLDTTNNTMLDFQNISLQKNKRMLSEITNNCDLDRIELFVIDENGKKIAKILKDGTEEEIVEEQTTAPSVPNTEITATEERTDEDHKNKHNTILIIILVAGALVASSAGAIITIVIIRNKRKKAKEKAQVENWWL